MDAQSYTDAGLVRRRNTLILAGAVALAVIGYVVGLRAGVPEGTPGLADAGRAARPGNVLGGGLPALTYAEVGSGALRADRGLQTWAAMTATMAAPTGKPVTDEVTRGRSLDERASRRAYNGAPPVIPHAAHGLDDLSCLACHGEALKIGTRTAKSLPHPYLTNCTQCHAAAAPAFLGKNGDGMLAESVWKGVAAPRSGPRATPGAPPAVPHTLEMRSNCMACHGAHGWPGMQTSHPERRNCLQCHAPIQDGTHPGRGLKTPPFLPAPKVGGR